MALNARELVSGSIRLVSLPEVFTRLNEMIDNPHTTAADIGHLIMNDPALCARLLKIVNSPFYGFPRKIDTITRAVTIIGTQELRDLVLATSVVKVFAGIPNFLVNMDSFWQHSVACALAARALAARCGETHIERFFVGGLLHDIGTLLLYHKLPELMKEVLLRATYQGEPFFRAEQNVLGFDHAHVGRELLKLWRLPAHLVDAVGYHHTPQEAPASLDAAIVHVANIVANALQFGNAGDKHVAPFAAESWGRLGLSVDVLEPLALEIEQQFSTALQLIYHDSAAH